MSKPCFVYVIESEAPAPPSRWRADRPYFVVFKVGITGNLGARFHQLKNASAYRLEVRSKWKLPSREMAEEIEKFFQAHSARDRLSGEWFYGDVNGSSETIHYEICVRAVEKFNLSFAGAVEFVKECGYPENWARDTVLAEFGADALA